MNTTNLLDQLEQPLVTPETVATGDRVGWIDALLTWSLQFEVSGWLILFVLLALFVLLTWELHSRLRRHRPADVRTNRRRHEATSLLTSLR